MKKTTLLSFLLISVFFFSFAAFETNDKPTPPYTITVSYASAPGELAYLIQVVDKEPVTIDSCVVTDNKIVFKGTVALPEMMYVSFGDPRKMTGIFVENSEINVVVSAENEATVSGSVTHEKLNEFNAESEKFSAQLNAIYEAYKEAAEAKDSLLQIKTEQAYDSIEKAELIYTKSFVKSNSTSVVSPYLTLRYLTRQIDVTELEETISAFDASISSSRYVVSLNARLAKLKKVEIGMSAPEITLTDTLGDVFALSSLKGDYVLIDFWASWCGPCRRENPNVVRMYNLYHDRGFEILGVSFDTDGARWRKAIVADSLSWRHISDLKGWKSAAGQTYVIGSIPSTVLLDPEGKIIAKDLRGEALESKLEELFPPIVLSKKELKKLKKQTKSKK